MASEQDGQVERLLAQSNWHEERKKLRSLILDCGLEENVKWGKLCYASEGSNVVIIFALKDYFALGFFKGALIDDERDILVRPGEHSQAMRQIRFAGLKDIVDSENMVRDYIGKAIQAEKDGLEVDFAEKDNLSYPDELQACLDDDQEFAAAFEALTPGRRRGYVLHISGAKTSATRMSLIEKARPRVLGGKGLNER
jgi:uncharacterized protein YdeI (YjbR/CyaY-like superfamily)